MVQLPYPPSRYDENFNLRVSPMLWLAILWSMHPALLLVAGAFAQSGEIFKAVVDYGYNAPSLLSSIPGAAVLTARMNRAPEAGERIRWIWRNGRVLLALGLSMQLGTVFLQHWKEVTELQEAILASLVASAILLVFVLASRYNRDLFADFPAPEPKKQ